MDMELLYRLYDTQMINPIAIPTAKLTPETATNASFGEP